MLNLIDCLFFFVIFMLVLFYVCFTFIRVCEFCIFRCGKIRVFLFFILLLSYSLFVRLGIPILFLYLFTCLLTFFWQSCEQKGCFPDSWLIFVLSLFLVFFKYFFFYVCGLFCLWFLRWMRKRREVRFFLYLFMPPIVFLFFHFVLFLIFVCHFFYLDFCFVLIILGFCSFLYLWVSPFTCNGFFYLPLFLI